MTMADTQSTVICNSDTIHIRWGSGNHSELPHLWLRDNCGCDDCRITQTSEKKFYIASIPAEYEPSDAYVVEDRLHIVWPDGHRTVYEGKVLRKHVSDEPAEFAPWPNTFVPESYPYRAFLDDDRVAAAMIRTFTETGVTILKDAPTSSGTLEILAPRLGPIRELLFARIHDVQVDSAGYNVAHTDLPLPPHNDFASYTWPPSVQALHMLENETPGGESFVVDGWAVLKSLRDDHPDYFEALCNMPVPFREFSDDCETFAVAPIVRLDSEGDIAGLRFSNQLMQAIDPNHPGVGKFYRAYHELCRRIIEPRYRSTFRLSGGEILIVAAHRVLHGREAFEARGRRNLQDAYFEFDNVRNHLVVLRRKGVI